jgi:hypothetical protein
LRTLAASLNGIVGPGSEERRTDEDSMVQFVDHGRANRDPPRRGRLLPAGQERVGEVGAQAAIAEKLKSSHPKT